MTKPDKPAKDGKLRKFLLHDIWDFVSSTGPMIIGTLIGTVIGGGCAVTLGFAITTGLLGGAVAGFLLTLILQAIFIGGG